MHWTLNTEHQCIWVSARCQIWNIKWCVQCAGKGDVQLCVFGIAQNMLHLAFALTLSSLLPTNCTQCANVCTLFFVTPSLQVHPLCPIILLAMHSYCALGIILQHSLFTSVVISKSVWETTFSCFQLNYSFVVFIRVYCSKYLCVLLQSVSCILPWFVFLPALHFIALYLILGLMHWCHTGGEGKHKQTFILFIRANTEGKNIKTHQDTPKKHKHT